MDRFLCGVLFLIGNSVPFFAFPQIAFDGNFDGARMDSAYTHPSGYTLAPHVSLFCKAYGLKDSTPVFRIYDSDGWRLRNDHRMVFRYAQDSVWNFFDNGSKIGSLAYYYFSNNSPFTGDTIFIAYHFPWNYQDQVDYMTRIDSGGSPYLLNSEARAISIQGRSIFGYEITNQDFSDCHKQEVVVIAKQHPTEFLNSHILNGMTDYLLYSTDSLADSLRKYFIFYFYPMMNPDGVFHGIGQNMIGQDLNRNWDAGTAPNGCPETDSIRPDIYNRTGGTVDYAIDIHSNAGYIGPYYYWGQKSGPDSIHVAMASQLVHWIHYHDSLDYGGNAAMQDTVWGDTYGGTALTAGNWLFGTLGAKSLTLEPSSIPILDLERIRNIGRSLAKGFAGMISTPSPMQLATGISPAGHAYVTVNGGLPPYSFLWDDSLSQTTDTLFNPMPGIYTIWVSDSTGCTDSGTVEILPSLSIRAPDDQKLIIFPNPSEGVVKLILPDHSNEPIDIRVYDKQGRILYEQRLVPDASNILKIDLSILAGGWYQITLEQSFRRITTGIILK